MVFVVSKEKERNMDENLRKNLTRYRIDDLEKELTDNRVSRSRHKDIIRFFKKTLGDGPYYAICFYNDGMKHINTIQSGKFMPRNYSTYIGNESYSLRGATGQVDDSIEFPMVVQELNPKTVWEFYNQEKSTVYYINADFLKEE